MANRKFTKEEMNHLRASPYVLDVTPTTVHFSAKFKETFWKAVLASEAPRDIVSELGIDPDILGVNRVNGLKGMIRNEVKAGKGFRDVDTYARYLDGYMTPEGRIKYLEQQLAYKDQEIEFLKNSVLKPRGYKDMSVPACAKYEIIREMTQQADNLLNTSWLCITAGVSRSG